MVLKMDPPRSILPSWTDRGTRSIWDGDDRRYSLHNHHLQEFKHILANIGPWNRRYPIKLWIHRHSTNAIPWWTDQLLFDNRCYEKLWRGHLQIGICSKARQLSTCNTPGSHGLIILPLYILKRSAVILALVESTADRRPSSTVLVFAIFHGID